VVKIIPLCPSVAGTVQRKMRKLLILIVEDELGMAKFIRANLEANGFDTVVAMDGAEALQAMERDSPGFVILDIMIPKMDGFEVLRRIREWSQIPIIMLSARRDEKDKVKCLELGADDYIPKPFGVDELLARVRAVLRRTSPVDTTVTPHLFKGGYLTIDFVRRQVIHAGSEVELTPTEYSLLRELALNEGKVLSHADLLRRVWGTEYGGEREYLRVFINRLRAKLKSGRADIRYIASVRNVGYRFQASS